jgi:hypothetical protein
VLTAQSSNDFGGRHKPLALRVKAPEQRHHFLFGLSLATSERKKNKRKQQAAREKQNKNH